MPGSKHRTEVFVGLFVMLGVALLAWLILHFDKFQASPGGGYAITVEVRDATGIYAGVPVRLGGVEIGTVSSDPELNSDSTSLSVELTIFPGRRIPLGSAARVGTSGLMGDSFVRIIPPEKPSGEFLPEGHRIQAESVSSLNDLAGSAGETLDQVTETAGEIRAAADRFETLSTTLEKGFMTEENMKNLSVILAEMRASSEYVHAAAKKLDPLLEETGGTLNKIAETADAAKSTLARVDEGVTQLSSTLVAINPVASHSDQTIKDLSKTLISANKLINTLENGDGLAPALLKDSELKRDLESFLDKLDRNGLILYPREGGFIRDSATTELSQPSTEKRAFPGPRKQP
ncbi:MAG TPA: MlaD family protein [Verrucomicrobiales bacterium]|nr:MlaD family protein [Verrucomicrobiales bacterium]